MSPLGTVVRVGARLTGVATAGTTGYVGYLYQTDEGTRRMFHAYGTFVPVVLHYRWVEFKHKHLTDYYSEEEWDELDEWYAKPTVETLAELQGMYCKYGQTAAGFTNTLGEKWIAELRTLENEVPPRDAESVFKTIIEETGRPVEDTFSEFSETPLGSASIGQVHEATLKENGQKVAVKVQYPEAQQLFRKDMWTIRYFCETFAPEHVIYLEALEKQNAEELDYTNEANNLNEIRANMIKHGFQPREVVVPAPISELSTKRLLVMELLPGPKLIDGMRAFYSEWAVQHGTTLHDLEVEMRKKIEEEGIPARYDGPSALTMAWYRRWLWLRDKVTNVGVASYNSTIGLVAPNAKRDYVHSALPPNTPRLLDILMRVHGYQLLADGCFNSDPHGGNFLLLPDGRIGLIDYGATKRLTRNERLSACLLYAALGRMDEKLLFTMSDIGGYKSKHGRRDVLLKLMQFGYDSWGHDVTEGRNIQQFLDEMKRLDPWEEVPDNLVLVNFMSIRLRSLALGMNHPVKCSEYWGPIAEGILKREGLPYESWDLDQLLKYKPEINMQKYKMS